MNKYTQHPQIQARSRAGSCDLGILYIKEYLVSFFPPDLTPSSPDPIYTHDSSSNFPIPCSLSSKISWSIVNDTGVTGGSWKFSALSIPEPSHTLLELHPNPTPAWYVSAGAKTSLMATEVKNHDLSTKISTVSIDNRGTYTCSLEFKSRTLSRIVKVEVLQGEHDLVKNLSLKLLILGLYSDNTVLEMWLVVTSICRLVNCHYA